MPLPVQQFDEGHPQMDQVNLTDMETLTEFVVNNAELERLEEKLQQFNIFEAIGMQWQEIRHSAFLAFLLDPQQSHGLNDDFLRKVLQRALLGRDTSSLPISVVKLHLMALSQTVVEREWNNIDILLWNESHKLAVIIENKVWTGEHGNQLDRYYRIVQKQYPDARIFGLYLTPDGATPSDSRYLPISYADIADILVSLVISRESVLGPDVRAVITHYVQMLRRNVVNDAEIDDLCRQIYQKHKRAIDLIITRLPDRRAQIINYCKSLVNGRPELRFRVMTKAQVGFHPVEWDTPALQYYPPEQSQALIFELFFVRENKGLTLIASIRPGREEVRQKLFDMTQANLPLFSQGKLYPNYTRVYSRALVKPKPLEELEIPLLRETIAREFDKFVQTDLPRIQKIVMAEAWVWEKDASFANEGATPAESAAINSEGDEQGDRSGL